LRGMLKNYTIKIKMDKNTERWNLEFEYNHAKEELRKWGSEVNRLKVLLAPPKTPMEEREWNYSFTEGDEVMFAPDLPDNYFDSVGDFLVDTFLDLRPFKDYRGKKGIVTKCWSDLHAFGRGSSYMCEVKFDKLTHSTMCQFFVKYEVNG
jgi:hypothetical protein